MRYSFQLLLTLLVPFLFSCDKGMAPDAMESSAPEAVATTLAKDETQESAGSPADRKIIRQANLRFQVNDLATSTDRIESLLDRHQAYLSNSSSHSSDDHLEAELTIKVLPANLDRLVTAILEESTFLDNKTISSNDVTLEYVDVAARIKAKQAVEQRYLELLKQANKIPDVLAIEGELKKIREELEAMQARQQALQQLTSYSTIQLSLYQVLPPSFNDQTGFLTQAISALEGGWHFLKDILIGVFYLWPLWLFIPAAFWIYKRIKKQPAIQG